MSTSPKCPPDSTLDPQSTELGRLLTKLLPAGNAPDPHPASQDEFFYCPLQVAKNLTPEERAELFLLNKLRLARYHSGVCTYDLDDDWDLTGKPFPLPTEGWLTPEEAFEAECIHPQAMLALGENGKSPMHVLKGAGGGAWGAPSPGIRNVYPSYVEPGATSVVLTLVGEGLLPEGKILITHADGTIWRKPAAIIVKNFFWTFVRSEFFDIPDWPKGERTAVVSVEYASGVPSPKTVKIDVGKPT